MDDWSPEELEMATNAVHEGTMAIDQSFGSILTEARELGLRGWTVPVQLPPILIPAIVRRVPAAQTDAFFLYRYTQQHPEEFRRMVSEVTTHRTLERWWPLLVQASDAYDRQAYLLIVPVLLTVFEGALASVVGRPHDAGPKSLASTELDGADRNLERLAWHSIAAFTEVVFQNAAFSGGRPNLLNRHWVLHGRDAPKWNIVDALRLFQALRTLCSAKLLRRRDVRTQLRESMFRAL